MKKEVSDPAPSAQKNLNSRPPVDKDDSDDYDDDFDDMNDKLDDKKANQNKDTGKDKASDWDDDLDGDWGELEDNPVKRKEENKTDEDKKRQLMFGGAKDDFTDLDDLPDIGSNFPKNDDKFNQVMSSSKEGGGLLASIGMKKEDLKDDSVGEDSEEDPHKKSDLFDTSKDRIGG